MTKEEVGRILKQLRIESGKTQKEVASLIGRTQQIIGHWETGYSQPDADTLFTLCNIYGVSVDEAFGLKKSTSFSFSQEALKVASAYEKADAGTQASVRKLLDISDAVKSESRAIG